MVWPSYGLCSSDRCAPATAYTEPVIGTETTRREGPSGTWLDEGEVSPAWPAPAGNPARRPRVPGSLVYGGVVLALVLLIAIVWRAGGFAQRTDLLRPVEPGAIISTGPYEFSFTEATAQQQPDFNRGAPTWQIVIIGRARNLSDTSLIPPTLGGQSMFAIKDRASGLSAEPSNQQIGDASDKLGLYSRSALSPGLPSIGYRLVFPMPAEFRPGPTILLGVSDLVYRSKYLTNDKKAWDTALYGSRIDLPLRILSPQE
jgi:hypothetical protein